MRCKHPATGLGGSEWSSAAAKALDEREADATLTRDVGIGFQGRGQPQERECVASNGHGLGGSAWHSVAAKALDKRKAGATLTQDGGTGFQGRDQPQERSCVASTRPRAGRL